MRATILAGMLAAAAVLGASLLACTQTPPPIPDTELSLRKGGLGEPTREAAPQYSQQEPGESTRLARGFYGAPPMIPHSITDMAITATSNDCLDCHESGDKDTPGIPPSHRIKVRMEDTPRAQAKAGQVTAFAGFYRVRTVAGNRYECLLCHAPQAQNAAPLVDNTFQPQSPGQAPADALGTLNEQGNF